MPRQTAAARYDHIVVGAGPAGCAVAARLSRLPDRRVLLIEAGGSARSPLLSVPVGMILAMTHPRFTWQFETEAEPGLAGRAPPWFAGRALGGGSAINGMMYLRGHPHDYDRWRDEAGCAGWSFEDVLPFFRRAETSDRGEGPWHGGSGPIHTSRGVAEPAIAPAFLDLMAAGGVPLVDDLNAGAAEGAGYFDRAVARGRRSSAAPAYLRGVANRRSLDVLTGAQVTGLIVERGRVRGVRLVREGRMREIRADAEIILTAGCVNSARLMLLSGIGPADELRRHGIAVAVDAPGVGRNLQNHVAYSLRYRLDAPITAFEHRRPFRAAAALASYALFRRGVLAGPLCPAGALLRTDPASPVADTQVILGAGLPGEGRGAGGRLPRASGFTLMMNQGRPFSRGAISLRSADPAIPPMIRSGHLADPRDVALLGRAVGSMRDLLASIPIAGEMAREIGPHAGRGPGAVPADIIRAGAHSYYHAAGSCRMGEDAEAVVDTALRVRGIDGLRIADTSIAPLLVNGNTTAMALMIGERAAELIAGTPR